jgi:hypothetical protein
VLIATQSQILLDLDLVATQPVASIALTASPVLAIAPIAPTIQAVLTAPIASTTQAIAPIASTASTALKQLSLDRPEVLMQAYLAEKAAWLAQYPIVRPAEYRKAWKWKTLRPKVLKEQAFYMPRERCDLIGSIIVEKANWTNKEITVWLDNKKRKEEEEYNRLESEFVRNSNRYTENTR